MDINKAFQTAVIVNVMLCLLILGAAIKVTHDRERIDSLTGTVQHYRDLTRHADCGIDCD